MVLSQARVTPAFKNHLKTKLAPVLRESGFRGSSVTFRRLSGVVVQVIHLQGSRYGDSCCVEIGTHLTFLPTVLEDPADPRRIATPLCEFRRRLAPENAGDHWWPYGATDREAADSVDDLLSVYTTVGVPYLARFAKYPDAFGIITPEDVAAGRLAALPGSTSIARAALAMARISLNRSLPALAKNFIDVGLHDLAQGPVGAAIQRQLLDVERSLQGAG